MAEILDSKLEFVKKFYYQDLLSARMIAEKLGVSIDAVYYFMRKYKIKRRNLTEHNAATFFHKPPSFCLKKSLTAQEKELKLLGIVLYWGEGYKVKNGNTVDFANSDPAMISVFVKFLRVVCGVTEERLRVYLYCYSNQNPTELIKYWSQLSGIPSKQFSKPYVRNDYKLGKEDKMRYGLIHVRYNDKKLWLVIMQWIEEYKSRYA